METSVASIGDLPDEIVTHVLSFVDPSWLWIVARVCRYWRRAVKIQLLRTELTQLPSIIERCEQAIANILASGDTESLPQTCEYLDDTYERYIHSLYQLHALLVSDWRAPEPDHTLLCALLPRSKRLSELCGVDEFRICRYMDDLHSSRMYKSQYDYVTTKTGPLSIYMYPNVYAVHLVDWKHSHPNAVHGFHHSHGGSYRHVLSFIHVSLAGEFLVTYLDNKRALYCWRADIPDRVTEDFAYKCHDNDVYWHERTQRQELFLTIISSERVDILEVFLKVFGISGNHAEWVQYAISDISSFVRPGKRVPMLDLVLQHADPTNAIVSGITKLHNMRYSGQHYAGQLKCGEFYVPAVDVFVVLVQHGLRVNADCLYSMFVCCAVDCLEYIDDIGGYNDEWEAAFFSWSRYKRVNIIMCSYLLEKLSGSASELTFYLVMRSFCMWWTIEEIAAVHAMWVSANPGRAFPWVCGDHCDDARTAIPTGDVELLEAIKSFC